MKCLLQKEGMGTGKTGLQETDISSVGGEESFQERGGDRWEFANGGEFQKARGGVCEGRIWGQITGVQSIVPGKVHVLEVTLGT